MTLKYLHRLGKRGYRIFSKAIRKLIAHKRSRLGFHACLIAVILVVGTFPSVSQVFGQVEATLAVRPMATEEVIFTTKRTSKLPVLGGLSQGFSYYHPGVDIQSPLNTPIHAFLQGVILEAGFQTGGYGNYILIDHENGYFSLYAHLSKILVMPGERIDQERIIGNIGVTGFSTGSHLHFEIYENGFAVNPLAVLPEIPATAPSFKTITGGSSTGRPLILPIAQQATFVDESKVEAKTEQEKEAIAVWLPNEIKTTNLEKVSEKVDSKVSHQLPTLDPILLR